MPFNWKDYKEIADFLKEQGDNGVFSEASYRSAVSRYYYAAFCHARNYARDGKEINVPTYKPSYSGEDHRRIIEHYKNYFKVFGNVHSNLYRLLELRGECDYNDEVDDHAGKATMAESLTQSILVKLP